MRCSFKKDQNFLKMLRKLKNCKTNQFKLMMPLYIARQAPREPVFLKLNPQIYQLPKRKNKTNFWNWLFDIKASLNSNRKKFVFTWWTLLQSESTRFRQRNENIKLSTSTSHILKFPTTILLSHDLFQKQELSALGLSQHGSSTISTSTLSLI